MTEELLKSLRKIKCASCGEVVAAVPSPFVQWVRDEGGVELQSFLAYNSDEEIGQHFRPGAHTLPGSRMWCVAPQR